MVWKFWIWVEKSPTFYEGKMVERAEGCVRKEWKLKDLAEKEGKAVLLTATKLIIQQPFHHFPLRPIQ